MADATGPDPTQGALALQSRHDVVRQFDVLHRASQYKLAGVKDERFVIRNLLALRQVRQVFTDVDIRLAGVPEDQDRIVQVKIDAGRLNVALVQRIDDDSAGREFLFD